MHGSSFLVKNRSRPILIGLENETRFQKTGLLYENALGNNRARDDGPYLGVKAQSSLQLIFQVEDRLRGRGIRYFHFELKGSSITFRPPKRDAPLAGQRVNEAFHL